MPTDKELRQHLIDHDVSEQEIEQLIGEGWSIQKIYLYQISEVGIAHYEG